MKFVDLAYFNIKSGKGGDGAVSFRHELYVPDGGPNGGDGGKGGDVIFVADEGKSSLLDLKLQKFYAAQDGFKGDIKNMHGKNGKDVIIKVPVGTVLYDAQSNKLLADFIENDQTQVLAIGGRGGRGNARFANSRNKAPTIFEAGDPAIEINIKAELKVLADVGFVGLPNAGKSTLLRAISNSKPEVADYPFTTINPQLGVSRDKSGRTFTVADLPGLIAGASLGKGLGHEFLRHIERCRIICHVIDMSGNYGTEDVVQNYELIKHELKEYNLNLDKRFEIIVANKIDLDEAQINVLYFKEKYPNKLIVEISGLKKQNIEKLLLTIGDALEQVKDEPLWLINDDVAIGYKVYKFEGDTKDVQVKNLGNGRWSVSGADVLKVYQKTPISTDDNLLLFNEKLKKLGVYDTLREKGAQKGDYVRIFDIELEWMD
ncbi:GTPase ObgE [Spiroplasma clarkii]|uniref:GTPase Obg n=1 Tax=Spiroplasma clarkii TaxID=2139 RepID=A0A1Y0L1S0_9MOLU|nr:GTPase ObgE [Spiroplasma clarkii]ARU91974.1 GTPase ObgE [Spiroplasma clarkii]ATX71314.1 GTPase ObgE [Spiroplasma clarkii]